MGALELVGELEEIGNEGEVVVVVVQVGVSGEEVV